MLARRFTILGTTLALAALGGCEPETKEARPEQTEGAALEDVVEAAPNAVFTPAIDVGPDTTDQDGEPFAAVCTAGEACDDGDPCTADDRCDDEGGCSGAPRDCDDGLECTSDVCIDGACQNDLRFGWCIDDAGPGTVCVAEFGPRPSNPCTWCDASADGGPSWGRYGEGAPCDDGDACTAGDACWEGECAGKEPVVCPDNPCAALACDPEQGCVGEPVDGPCDDGDPCTLNDFCEEGVCKPGTFLNCDDGDPCSLDICDPAAGCINEPGATCDDGDPCTVDTCQPGGTCVHEPFSGPCDDGDPCTAGEVCSLGFCGGGEPLSCDDDNPCTGDLCDPEVGCRHTFLDLPCYDGYYCTVADACVTGMCVGEKTGCAPCSYGPSEDAVKLVLLEISGDGQPDSGLDVDGNPATCRPAGSCSGGVDNALAPLAPMLNAAFAGAIASGALSWVFDMRSANMGGSAFPMPIYDAELAPSAKAAGCDPSADSCAYVARQSSFKASCAPYFAFPEASVQKLKLRAGGAGTTTMLGLTLGGTSSVPVSLGNARIEAGVTLDGWGEAFVGVRGVIAGAIPKEQLLDAIERLSPGDDDFDREALMVLLEQSVEEDIDLDGDGDMDAASVAFRFEAVAATLQ